MSHPLFPANWRRIDQPPQDPYRPYCANREQRRQAEQQRREHSGRQPFQHRPRRKLQNCVNRKKLSEDKGQDAHDAEAGGHAQHAPGHAETKRLQKIDSQQITRLRADSLEDGEDVHALLKVRIHRHGHTDGAEHHGDEANQTENGHRPLQSLIERRISFFEVCNLRIGKRRFDLGPHVANVCTLRQLDQQTMARAAAGRQ